MGEATVSTQKLALMRAEYHRLKMSRTLWRILSLAFGASGILLVFYVAPHLDGPKPLKETQTGLATLALVLFGLGLMFSGKVKGRGFGWGFSALRPIGLFRRAAEPDLLKLRIEGLRRTLEAHGEIK